MNCTLPASPALLHSLVWLAFGLALWGLVAVSTWRRRARAALTEDIEAEDEDLMDEETDQYTLPLERRYPELARRLQETALRLAQEKGTITSDDVWDAHPIPAGIEPRIMASAFKPRTRWRKTGQYVPTRRPSANRRPIPCWELREAAA